MVVVYSLVVIRVVCMHALGMQYMDRLMDST
jgi:hypothetical protein